MATAAVVLSPADFFSGLRKGLKTRLALDRRNFELGRRGRLAKVHYSHPAFHYEAWHHTGAGRLEIGLHFEGAMQQNHDAFDFFRPRMVEVKAFLPRAELEPWDRGWSRLYETFPAPHLDEHVLDSAIETMAAYITTLQPMLEVFLGERAEQ